MGVEPTYILCRLVLAPVCSFSMTIRTHHITLRNFGSPLFRLTCAKQRGRVALLGLLVPVVEIHNVGWVGLPTVCTRNRLQTISFFSESSHELHFFAPMPSWVLLVVFTFVGPVTGLTPRMSNPVELRLEKEVVFVFRLTALRACSWYHASQCTKRSRSWESNPALRRTKAAHSPVVLKRQEDRQGMMRRNAPEGHPAKFPRGAGGAGYRS